MNKLLYILSIILFTTIINSCSQVSDSDNMQELINEEREANKRAEEYERNKIYDETQRDYQVRRIPQQKENNKPDDD